MVGAAILRKEGVEERYALVCEHHTGAGILAQDIEEQKLDLPVRDFLPTTREEKIIAFADKLGKADREWTLQEVKARYAKELGQKYADRIQQLADEVEQLGK